MTGSYQKDADIVLAICTFALFVKMVITFTKKGMAMPRPPEDYSAPDQQPLTSSDEESGRGVSRGNRIITKNQRWTNIADNDLENIPIALIILWANKAVSAQGIVTSVCAMIFTVSRISYTILYAYQKQPWRSVAYSLALMSIVAASLNLIVGAFQE